MGRIQAASQPKLRLPFIRVQHQIADLRSGDPRAWYTHFPNDPTVAEPDRTIDYQLYSDQWLLDEAYIIQGYGLEISDHLPVVGNYSLPTNSRKEESTRQAVYAVLTALSTMLNSPSGVSALSSKATNSCLRLAFGTSFNSKSLSLSGSPLKYICVISSR